MDRPTDAAGSPGVPERGDQADRPRFEAFIQCVIFYSIGSYLFELEWGGDRAGGHPFFVWSERVVAGIFTAEYFFRWVRSRSWAYPLRPAAVIDLLAVLPFYPGSLVDGLVALRLVRTLRLLRLFKLFKGAKTLERVRVSFADSASRLTVVGLVVALFVLFSSVVVYESERKAQPETFDGFGDAVWWSVVTMTTVGYGDLYPKTPFGRAVAVATIVFGIALFGTLLSALQDTFAATKGTDDDPVRAELREVKQRLAAVEDLLKRSLERK